MDDHSSRQLGEELNQLFSKWQENFQPLEPHLSTFQEIADSVAELANDGADSSIFSTQQVTTGPLEEELVAENLWRPMEEQGTKSLIELGPGVDSITSSHLEKLQRNDERILSNCAVDKFCESLIDIASREVEHRSSCLATFDVHNLSVDSSSRPSHSAFGTEDSHYLSYLLFLNRRKLQAVEDCLEKIDSIQKLDTLSQQQKNNGSSVSHGSRTSMPWYWSWIRTNSQKNAVHSLEHPPYTTALFKYANYFIQRLGFSSSNLFKGYVPFCGVEIVKKGRREVLEPKRHSDTERVGSQKRKELGISFEKSFRPRNFQQVLEKMVIRSAQEERYQELVDELTKGVIGHHEFRNKIKEISEMSLLDASYQSVHWSREKWVGLLEQNTSKLSKNVQVDDVRLYWVNYGASFYRKDSFSKEEDEEILQAVQQLGEHSWVQVANRVNSGRSPWQYFCRYQRTLRPTCLTCKWTMEEDMKLLAAIEKYGTKQWSLVSCNVPGRTRQQCLHRWRRGLCPNIHHGKWTVEEDELLRKAVVKYGEGHWSQIAQMVPGRTDLQCRERYTDVLKPSLSHQPWTHEENERLLQLTQEMGTGKWSLVASFMKNRTDNQCYRQYKKLKSETR
ncbi:hypothetical protein Gasu_37900 isoform 2 [Galdieria sulphuraria]|nr:hypothetical protein Gasu_37900 isoform 2 [Galdieria sulphuraria]EME28740.1 hypothetical protein isoform 2 [Galdieria sulphuraria]|eukprot:XP_005705260.1 hypothetical protein isoform 2 [Galdieria sulphuraria]